MKRILFSISMLFVTGWVIAQEPVDALRYSMLGHGGTARSLAIGGAMTSLGGDIASATLNPAGLGFFKTSEFVLTPSFSFNNNRINYLDTKSKEKKSGMALDNIGLVLARPGSMDGKWRNFTYGIGLNRTAQFNNRTKLKGNNSLSSFSEKYLEQLINNNITDPNDAATRFPYGSSLAFNTFLIDTINGPGNTIDGYRSLSTPQTGVVQEQDITTTGGINEFYFSGSANYMDRIYIGGGITFSSLSYERTSVFRESDATNDKTNFFNYFTTEEYLRTEGMGVGVKLGVIIKPVDQIRIGIAFHSPTVYNMKDQYTTKITTDLEGYERNGVLTQSSVDLDNNLPGEFQYEFSNPMRMQFGLSYVFKEVSDVTKQKGFISADIEWLNYGKSTFTSGSNAAVDYINDLNQATSDQFRSALNMRIGGELKFKTIMTRLGFNYMGNAYTDAPIKNRQMNISGGLGYRNFGFFADLTYVHQLSKDFSFPYVLDNGFFAPGYINGSRGNVILTVGFKL